MPNDEFDPAAPSNVARDRCLRCGRLLRSAESRWRGYGEECWTSILSASRALTLRLPPWKPNQLDRAVELMREGGIVLWRITTRTSVYRSVSSDGKSHYLTTIQACNCPAGLWGGLCYHQLAVLVLRKSIETARSRHRYHRKESVK